MSAMEKSIVKTLPDSDTVVALTKRCRKILILGFVLLLLLIVIAIAVPLIIMGTTIFTGGDVEGKDNTTFTGGDGDGKDNTTFTRGDGDGTDNTSFARGDGEGTDNTSFAGKLIYPCEKTPRPQNMLNLYFIHFLNFTNPLLYSIVG